MALKPCRECGKEVSTEATTCPHCGVSQPTKSAASRNLSGFQGCAVILLLVVAAGVVSSILAPATRSPRQRTAARVPDLTATVRSTATDVRITNGDSFDWTNCTVRLNPTLTGSWSQRVGRIGAGETVSGGLMAFTRGNGERFNPVSYAVEGVGLSCDTPRGRASWAGAFN